MVSPIRIIIVEDHPLVRLGLQTTLSADRGRFDVVGTADCAEALRSLMKEKVADVILLDLILPGESGVEIARELRKQGSTMRILVLSAETTRETISELVRIGIDGFINKSVSPEELKTAIEYVADGLEYYGRDIARILRDFSNARKGLKTNFTKRESEILELCARGLSAKDISRRLDISINTVNSHKDNIFKKLGINSSLELVRWSIDHSIISI